MCQSLGLLNDTIVPPGEFIVTVKVPTPSDISGDIYQCTIRVVTHGNSTLCASFDEYFVRGISDYFSACVAFIVASAASWHLGKGFPTLRLPLITGYVIIGVIVGPFVCNLVTSFHVYLLGRAINDFVLSFISFAAGEEIYFPALDGLLRPIFVQIAMITVSTMLLVSGGLFAIPSEITDGLETRCRFAIALLLGVIMVARSPATAVAVVQEVGNENVNIESTKVLLGVTVMSDIVVLIGFAIVSTVVAGACNGGSFDVTSIALLVGQFAGIAIFGLAVGLLIYLILLFPLKRFQVRTVVIYRSYLLGLLILPLGPVTFSILRQLERWSETTLHRNLTIDPLMVCLFGAMLASNRSQDRGKFGNILHKCGPYVFLPFFTLTGASLKLDLLWKTLPLASMVCALRVFSIFIASFVGSKWFKVLDPNMSSYLWLTLLSQAGVALGLAMEVASRFTETAWAEQFQTLLLSVVVLNQVIGPPLCKLGILYLAENDEHVETPRFGEDSDDLLLPSDPPVTMSMSRAYTALGSQRRINLVDQTNDDVRTNRMTRPHLSC